MLTVLARYQVTPQQCIFVEIGHDGFQPWNNTTHRSTWGIWLRVKNVCPSIFFRYMNVKELGLLPQARRPRADNVKEKVEVHDAFL